MKSIKDSRLASVTVAGLSGSFFQNLISSVVEDFFQGKDIAIVYIVNTLLSLGLMLVVYWLSFKVIKAKWFRRVVFGEKIIDGVWFGCLYDTEQRGNRKACFVAKTYFDERTVEFIFAGTIYSLDGRLQIGSFESVCSSCADDQNFDGVQLMFAHNFCINNISSQGFGETRISFLNNSISDQEGRFVFKDSNVYHFRAIAVPKKTSRSLCSFSDIRVDKILELLNKYDSINQKVESIYEKELYLIPEHYYRFSRAEDYLGNLKKAIRSNDFRDKIVLDMGVGTGRFAEYVLPDAKTLICSDHSLDMIEYSKNLDFAKKNQNKIEFIHSDHMSLYSLLANKYEGKIDYIIAGYSIGAFYNDNGHTTEQSNKWLGDLIEKLKKLLTSNGKIIIVENLGIGIIGENLNMTENDWKLRNCYDCLESFGFVKEQFQTSFMFKDKQEANEIINIVWSNTEVSKCREEKDKLILDSASAVWTWENR